MILSLILSCALAALSPDFNPTKVDSLVLSGCDLDSLALELPGEYLDTVKVADRKAINDYSLIGVAVGTDFTHTDFNPSKTDQQFTIQPVYIGIFYTHHEKMFSYIPYFAFQGGFEYSHSGWSFKEDSSSSCDGAKSMKTNLVCATAMAQIHLDYERTKFIAQVGGYGGYRFGMTTEGTIPRTRTDYLWEESFRNVDYGLRGGAAFGLMFDPIEIHIGGLLRWSWSSFYKQDYYSSIYYRYAYPLEFSIYVSVNFQLTKRTGRTTKSLKEEAKKIVYGSK